MTYEGAALRSSADQGTPSTGVCLRRLRDVQCGLLITGELLVEVADLRLGQMVLEVAIGSGNTALAGACLFCEVNKRRVLPALLERGRERNATERLSTNSSSFRP